MSGFLDLLLSIENKFLRFGTQSNGKEDPSYLSNLNLQVHFT